MAAWRDAIRSELAAYQQETGEDIIDLQTLYDRSLDDLQAQFPENDNLKSKIRQTVQELRDYDELVSLGDGRYRIADLASYDDDSPSVWIEKTEIEGREYKQEGELKLGNAIYSPSQSKGGADIYDTLREAEVGDIVIHLLQDREQIIGVSVIDSELATDFEGLPEFGWTDEQKGYLRELDGYVALEDPISIFDDVLQNEQYREYLHWIRDEYDKIFFTKNLSLVQGGYFTQCPPELLQVLVAESEDLARELRQREYPVEELPRRSLEPAPNYDTITAAADDIQQRIEKAPEVQNPLSEQLTQTIVADWTEALSGLGPDSTVSAATAARLDQIATLYADIQSTLTEQAEQLKSGSLYSLDPAETLFVILLRQLQTGFGTTVNANHVKMGVILEEQYTIDWYQSAAADEQEGTDTDPVQEVTLEHPDHPLIEHVQGADVTTYKYTARPEYWLSVFEYSALAFEDSDDERRQWEEIETGDVVLFHSTGVPATDDLDSVDETLVGAAIAGRKAEGTGSWGDAEFNPGTAQPLILAFQRLFAAGEIEMIDREQSVPNKSAETLASEIDALSATRLPTTSDGDRILLDYLAGHVTEIPPIALHKRFQGEIPDTILDGLYFPDDGSDVITGQIEAALRSGKHIIFTGPPGTGKTEVAQRVTEHLIEEYPFLYSGTQTTTATADWSTFDTVGGYMPQAETESQSEQLSFSPGVVLNRFKNHQTGTQRNEPIVIDEINRADIDKAFGQLFTTLSGQSVSLPYQRDRQEIELHTATEFAAIPASHQYVVPDSWRIFATMNTFDKTSLYEMSYAFMRRFSFIRIEVPELPENDAAMTGLIDSYIQVWDGIDVEPAERSAVGELWRAVNTVEGGRSLGPALIRDILTYLSEHRSQDLEARLTEAAISYVFPQLEGLANRDLVISSIASISDIDDGVIDKAGQEMLDTAPIS